MKKPKPPLLSQLNQEERARQALIALGVTEKKIDAIYDFDLVVLHALAEAWKKLNRAPTLNEVRGYVDYDELGSSRVRDAIVRLRERGLVISPRRGLNVPLL